jgi:hypothetical protein
MATTKPQQPRLSISIVKYPHLLQKLKKRWSFEKHIYPKQMDLNKLGNKHNLEISKIARCHAYIHNKMQIPALLKNKISPNSF